MVYRVTKYSWATLNLTLEENKTVSEYCSLSIKLNETDFKNLIINNSQYFYLELNYSQKTSRSKFVKPYFRYNGNSVRFTGNKVVKEDYGSIELPFGYFYKAQIEPFIESKYGVWPFISPVNTTLFKFIDGGPYFK
jgi:hypothetical protein